MTTPWSATGRPLLICIGCGKPPEAFEIYSTVYTGQEISNDEYVWHEEGTLNRKNGHFVCDQCYIDAGMPTSPEGWKAP